MIVGVLPVKSLDDLSKAWRVLETPLVDLVELRLDYLGSRDEALNAIREASEAGLLDRSIVTVRAWWEEGASKIEDSERVNLLKAALDAGARLVDLEVMTFERLSREELEGLDWSRVLLSLHVPLEKYSDGLAEYLLARAEALGAWGVKLAVRTSSARRASPILYWFLSEASRRGIRAAVMPYGCCKSLRLALYAAGSTILYVCARRETGATAEGQPCLEEDTDRSLVEAARRIRAGVVKELEG